MADIEWVFAEVSDGGLIGGIKEFSYYPGVCGYFYYFAGMDIKKFVFHGEKIPPVISRGE